MAARERVFAVGFWIAALACAALMGLNSLTRIRAFSPDSMSYVDVARNFAEGRGLSQSALGFGRARFSPDDPIPAPFTAHAPAFSIAIALTARAGIRFTDAALLLPIVFLGLSLWAGFQLARDCWNEAVGWLAVALLLNYYPLRHTSAAAWSENMATFFVLATLWLLARRERRGSTPRLAWLIGLLSGLAFATRYPMAPLVLVAALAMVRRPLSEQTARDGGWLAVGFMSSAGPVLLRNVLLTGSLMGSAPNPYHTPVLSNVTNTMWALSEVYTPYYLETPPRLLELRLLEASLVLMLVVLGLQRRLRPVMNEVILERGPRWILLWSLGYLAFLIVVRSKTWFDEINHRLTLPGCVGLAILWMALAAKTIRLNRKLSAVIVVGLILAALYREGRFFHEQPLVPRDALPQTSRLLWIQKNTTDRDLIVADYAMDVPFFFGRRNAIAFEHYPYTAKLTYEVLSAYLKRHCNEFDRAYLIVRDWYGKDRMGWRRAFGRFIADLTTGYAEFYPEYSFVAKLDDSYVFAIRKPTCTRERGAGEAIRHHQSAVLR